MDPLLILLDLIPLETVSDPARGRLVDAEQGERVLRVLERHGFQGELYVNEGTPIILSVAGEGRPVTLFMAHFDVVPPGPGWTRDPFRPVVEDGRVYGRGAADDKSNVAAIAAALAGYKPPRGTIVVAFTGDEEIGGRRGAAWVAKRLRSEGLWPDYLVNGDGSLSRVITRRRNAFSVRVAVAAEPSTATGTRARRVFETRMQRETMHSAYFVPGVDTHALVAASLWVRDRDLPVAGLDGEWVKGNVVPRSVSLDYVEPGHGRMDYDEGLTRLLYAVTPLTRTPLPTEAYSDYGVNINPNVYAHRDGGHVLHLDVRAMTMDRGVVESAFQAVAREALGDALVEVSGGTGYLYTPPIARIVVEALSINASLGLPAKPVEAGGASDSRYFSPHGVEAIDYGPLGGNIHGPDEWVSIDHLRRAARFYRMIAERLHSASN